MKKFFVIIGIAFFYAGSLFGVPATPEPITLIQPDGSQLTVFLRGDEHFNYVTSEDGYLLKKNTNNEWMFAVVENDSIIETTVVATDIKKRNTSTTDFLRTIEKNPDLSSIRTKRIEKSKLKTLSSSVSIQKSFPLSGNPKSLVILVNFSDKSFVVPDPIEAFYNLLNQEGYSANGGTGSARDYFTNSSFGQFTPEFDVVGPYTISEPYSYYGGSSGTENPYQMIKEACDLAYADGVDFTQYDTDNDGYVDNVFVYYAGNNQAEGLVANANTVWPHRFMLYSYDATYNGVRVYDYACSSELRSTGRTAAYMCGIGTFVHEFGHVLGLPDFYDTSYSGHHTLSYWSVMDSGPYLNNGRTPPSYSAFERFSLGWLVPREITEPGNIILDTLTTSNEALLISQNGGHNLNGANPSPTQFFMLENRQRTGWDSFLPNSGMLVTRINYSANKWKNNTVNNNSSSMGVDIIEADSIASSGNLVGNTIIGGTLSGDPFPGSSSKTSYSPTLRDGTDIEKPLTSIKERNGIITFKFMGGDPGLDFSPVAIDAADIAPTSAIARWTEKDIFSELTYFLDVYTKKEFSALEQRVDTINFENTLPDEWFVSEKVFDSISGVYGDSTPSLLFSANSQYIQTRSAEQIDSLKFWYETTNSVDSEYLIIYGTSDELNWTPIDTIFLTDNPSDTVSLYSSQLNGYTAIKIVYNQISGEINIDDIYLYYFGGEKDYQYLEYKNYPVGSVLEFPITNLEPVSLYYYRVQAWDGEKWSKKSNEIEIRTIVSSNNEKTADRISIFSYAGILHVNSDVIAGYNIQIYNTTGQLILSDTFEQSYNLERGALPTGVYIVKVGSEVKKIVW